MTGETKHAYAVNAKAPTSKEKDSDFERFSNKNAAESKSTGGSDSSQSALIAEKAAHLNGREKETHSQREAIIRPQQAGKIDFKSLHNRPKFSSEATWTNGKSSPLSPTGKSRGKDKNKRSGKGDRNQQQLYRLSISSSRSNPTIGIAYPQQKVTPPKKVEVSQGPVSGSYRFHVPSIPEREAELHQEDLNFNRSLQEPTSSLTSTNYTSQAAPASRIHHGLKIQPGNLHDTANTNGQLHYLEFQPSGNSWHSSDKHFPGAGGYAISSQKLCPFPEGNKSDSHSFVPVSFQYPFPSLQDPTGNSFCNNGNNQDFIDVALATNQVAHNTFFFQSTSREGPEDQQGNGSYNSALPESRTYGLPSQQAPFLHNQSTTPCYTGINEHSADHSGAITSSGALPSSGAIEQTQSTFQENQSVFSPSEFSLHSNSMPALINKRQQPPKDFVHSQRLLTPGNTLRRNIPQTSLNKVQFPSKVYNSVSTGSVPFEKNLSRIPQTWDEGSNGFPSLDQNSVSYPNASGNLIPYQCQPSDQRQALKNTQMSWQQGHLTSAAANQNNLELSRHVGNQKLPYSLSNQDWQNSNLMPKISPSYHAKKHLMVEGSSTQRTDTGRQSYNSSNDILYDRVKETNSQMSDSRTKGILYGMSQPIQQSRNNSDQPAQLSGNHFVAESSCESPLPSPANNPVSGSTCSSLSPMSSSPVNPSSDENQVPPTLISSPYFHQQCNPTEKSFHPTNSLSSGSLLYHSEPTKTFNFISDVSNEKQTFKNLHEIQYQKLSNEPSKGCLENFESEPPPPYSSHHFLASSLSSANLDQLDVLLTCKQCDQNFGNLSSFLEHRQYCHLNPTLQNETNDSTQGADMRNSAADPLKSSQTVPGLSLHKGQIEFHPHLGSFNKDYLLDSDAKGDTKEDHAKGNIFHNLTPNLLSLTACDTLEMDDAKLDSLIIEALNGLEFQVDNPEIDSTFIDVFVDDELTAPKATACSQTHKVKESTETKKVLSAEEIQAQHNQASYSYEESYGTEASYFPRKTIKMRNEHKVTEVGTAHPFSVNTEANIKQMTVTKSEDCGRQKAGDIQKCIPPQEKKKIGLSKNYFEYPDEKEYYDSQQGRTMRSDPQDFSVTETPKTRRTSLQDIKKKKPHNGTWSKELIHKIVQQKNKLHKLQVKSNKNVQLSLVTERLFPPTKSHLYTEYDYNSDSDEDVVPTPVQGKMQNGRLKYSFNRDLQARGGRTKVKEPVWRMGEATRFQLQSKDLRSTNKEAPNRIRRRSSQSSNSSDQSTSISSETGSSPKSTERTDSENEQECVLRCKTFPMRIQKSAPERNVIKPLIRGYLSEKQMHPDFSKGTKRFGSAKFLLASSKVYPSKTNGGTCYGERETLRQSTDSIEDNPIKPTELHCFSNAGEEDRLSTYQKAIEPSTLAQDNYTPDLLLDIDNVPQQLPTYADNTNYQEKPLNSPSCAPAVPNTDVASVYSDNSVKYLDEGLCNGHKDFAVNLSCYGEDPTVNILPQQSHKSYSNECQQFTDPKDMPSLCSNIFSKTQNIGSTNVEQIYANQSNSSNINSYENKCSNVASYPSDNNDKGSSALSFDSSSIFAELPISDFESPLYNSITPSKGNYVEYDQSSKSTHFEHQFPEFLQEKSWNLIGEGAQMSSNTVSPFQLLENQAKEKYAEHMPVSSEQMPIDLPRVLTDYNVPFINNMSEDELEIKRLVTELENELQTSKAQKDKTSQTSSTDNITSELTDSSPTFPMMEENTAESCRENAYFNGNPNYRNDMQHSIHPVKVDHIQDTQPLIKVDDRCESLEKSWTCAAQFDTFNSGIKCPKQTSTLESFPSTDNCTQYQSDMSNVCLTEQQETLSNNHSAPTVMSDGCLPNLSCQVESQTYSNPDLLRETLVTAETLLSKIQENKENTEKETKQSDAEYQTNKQQNLEDQFDDPPELEPFQKVSEFNSEFVLQDDNAPELNITKMPEHSNSVTDEPPCKTALKSTNSDTETDIEYYERQVMLNDKERLQKNDNMSEKELVLLDMPVLVKEESAKPEKATIAEHSAENPLQQLQLFVARTAKNNEVEMLMPCFPMLLAASGVSDTKPETESGSSHIVESTFISKVESEITAKVLEHKGIPKLSESCMQTAGPERLDASSEMLLESMSNEVHSDDKQTNHLEDEGPGLNAISIGTDRIGTDHDKLPCESGVADKQPQGLLAEYKEISNHCETDENRSLSSMKKRKSTSSSHTFHNETHTAGSTITSKVLNVQKVSPEKTDDGSPFPDALDIERAQMSKSSEEKQETQDINNKAFVFASPETHQQHMDILKETELFLGIDNTNETFMQSQDKGGASESADKSTAHFPLHPNANKVSCESNSAYDGQFHALSIPTAHSMLSFDLLPHISLKESALRHKLLFTTDDNLISIEREELSKTTQKCQSEVTSAKEAELEEHLAGGKDVELCKDKSLTSPLEASRKLVAEKDSMTPTVEVNLTPCFCSELVCTHYKDQHMESVADIILGCQSIPTNENYHIYSGESNHSFPALQNELFPETTQTLVASPLCSQNEKALKCEWNNTQDGSNVEHVFPSGEDGSSAMVCDLMEIAEPGFVNFHCHQKTLENKASRLMNDFNSITEVESSVLNAEPGKKCTNDMHSVIDGVLRILEGDKTKEILQSIGMSMKSSPIKERKPVGLSLTCDICSISFRSKPGLTRHKAVKHNGSLKSNKDGIISDKSLNVKNKLCVSDSQKNTHSDTSQNMIADFLNPDCSLQSSLLIPEGEKRPLSAKTKGEKRTNGQFDDTGSIAAACKKKTYGKIKKRKVKPTDRSTDFQGPPDEVLNILKTNILKAIGQSNSFNSSEEKINWEESSDKDIAQKATGLENLSLETYSTAINIDEDEKLVSDVLDLEMNGGSLLNEQSWTKSLNEHVEHIINDSKIQTEECILPKDHTLLTAREEHLEASEAAKGQNDVHVSNLSKGSITDLHALFDDDNTFSQLFPGDDNLIRRKCTRVYGKRSKKQTLSFEAGLKHADMAEHSHPSQINFTCDHRRISGNSALVDSNNSSAQTEHLTQYDHASPKKETTDAYENKMLPFVADSQAEDTNVPLLIKGTQDEKDRDGNLYKPCGQSLDLSGETGSGHRDPDVVEAHCKISDETGFLEFPTIDMKMLSAKFDMRELSFFSACGDDSDQSDLDVPDEISQTAGRRKKYIKRKLDERRQMRNRNNVKSKTKVKQYKCKVCFQWFLTLGELDFHKLTHNPSPPPTCYMCVQRKFSSREQLRDHLKEKHAKNKAGLWICGMCLKEISDVWMYNEHLREHATQFARKGQAQKSVMGIPGCYGEENMVRTFLSTFIYRTPGRLAKTSEADDKSPVSKRTDQKDHKDEDEVVIEKEVDNSVHIVTPAPIHVKLSVSPSLDSSQNDIIHKNPAMHPHCKDPSRDCHHCGKQFPKPFKLQRHLVVHSVQKIYLCHRCPKSYQEVQELRSHLSSEHQIAEKSEIKHTTLYACELCADVMHVIKKSFICSPCNYTFSKKEQYDRHMEKHLLGGSLTFKFRGVTRPTNSGKEIKEQVRDSPLYDSVPPSKKQKTSNYVDTSVNVVSFDHEDPPQCPKLSPGVLFKEEIEVHLENEHEVKVEEMLMDAPQLQAEGQEEQRVWRAEMCLFSPKPCAVEVKEKEDNETVGKSLAIPGCEITKPSFISAAKNSHFAENNAEFGKMTEMSTHELTIGKQVNEAEETLHMQASCILEDKDVSHLPLEEPMDTITADKMTSPSKITSKEPESQTHKIMMEDKEDTPRSMLLNWTGQVPPMSPKEKLIVNDTNVLVKDLKGLKKNKSFGQMNGRSAAQAYVTAANGEEAVKSSTPRFKSVCSLARGNSACTLKETTTSQQKLAKKELTGNISKNNTDFKSADKMSASMPPKQHQKKRKEHKVSGHKANTASQENLAGEGKKKTSKLVATGKSESSGNIKKPDWVNSLTDTKEEAPGSRLYPKPHTGGISDKLKKVVLDTHNQKKANFQSNNGEYKCKKAVFTKTLQPFTPKSSALSQNSPSHKRKMGHNAKPTEPSNYRTAESQNNLLSQLFGQKLTSFKIPLRRDITE